MNFVGEVSRNSSKQTIRSSKLRPNGHSRTISSNYQPSDKASKDVSFSERPAHQLQDQSSTNKLKMSLVELEAKNAHLTAHILNQQDNSRRELQNLSSMQLTSSLFRPGDIVDLETLQNRLKSENDKSELDNHSFILSQDHSDPTRKQTSVSQQRSGQDATTKIRAENAKLKEQVEAADEVNKWLKSQLALITNNEDWLVYKQLFTSTLTNESFSSHKYYFKNPQKKEALLKHLKEKTLLQSMLEMAEVNEHNIEKALHQKISHFQSREQELMDKIKTLEAQLKKFSKREDGNLVSKIQFQEAQNSLLTETIKNQLAEINSLKYELAKKVCSLDYQLKKEKNNNYALKEQLSSSENTLKNREAYWKEVDIAFSNYKNKFDSLFQENRLLKQQLEKASQHEKEEQEIQQLRNQIEELKEHHLSQITRFSEEKLAEERLLAKRIYELQDLVKALEVKKSNLEYSLEQVNLQKENLSKKSKDQEQEIEHLLEEIHQLRKKFTSNYPQGEDSGRSVQVLEKKLTNTSQKLNQFKKEISYDMKDSSKMQQQVTLNQLEIQIGQNRDESLSLETEVSQNLIEQLEFLAKQMGQLDAHFVF